MIMTNINELLNKLHERRAKRLSEVKKNLKNGVNRNVERLGHVEQKVTGLVELTRVAQSECSRVNMELSAEAKRQAELNEQDIILQEDILNTKAVCQELEKHAEKTELLAMKMHTKHEREEKNNELICIREKKRARSFQDLTGICWDYEQITASQASGYVKNSITYRMQTFEINSSNAFEVSEYMWDIIGKVSATK